LVQVASYLDRHQPYVPLESSPFYTERVRQFVHQHRKEMKETITTGRELHPAPEDEPLLNC